jgi:hypothetical protein
VSAMLDVSAMLAKEVRMPPVYSFGAAKEDAGPPERKM